MPNWGEVLREISDCPRKDALDFVRRQYLKQYSEKVGRNVIAYYSGFLQKPGSQQSSITDDDKNSLMACVHGLNRHQGLDLFLHTPGGDIAATESLVHYLRQMFGTNIRAVVPQIAMSAGTMIACSTQTIIMGKQSNIGPIDPQFNGIPAHGVLSEFNQAIKQTTDDPRSLPLWREIISKYHPTFLGECQHAVDLSGELLKNWLTSCMFLGDPEALSKAEKIEKALNNHSDTKIHARHIHIDEAKEFGLNITQIETDLDSSDQDLILTIHHAFMHTLANSGVVKIVENHTGQAVCSNLMR